MTAQQVLTTAACVLAPNPGPMTLEGTNSWVLREPGNAACLVIDPGPEDEGHLRALAAEGRVAQILLTHGHLDHSAGARRLHELTGAQVRALDPAHRYGGEGLRDGDVVVGGGIDLHVIATPGHSGDSLSFWLPGEAAVLTGDTVLGRGTTVVAHPDGRLGDYLASLRRLRALAEAEVRTLLPGHGPVVADAAATLDGYLAHRRERLEQVRAAVQAGAQTASDVVRTVYADVDPQLWPAAELSVAAQLAYLREHGG